MPAAAFGHKQVSKPDGSTPESWQAYVCGHCGNKVSGAVLASVGTNHGTRIVWLQCPACHDASVRSDSGAIHPGAPYGPLLQGLPDTVREAYEEARLCLGVNANTAAEMTCRKILMHVAVDKGAKEGQTFASYIDYLADAGYVTPPMRGWVKLIKDNGNEANHRLPKPDKSRAESTLQFTAQLLRSVYEMAHLAEQYGKAEAAQE
jgi:hypothetical protein